MHVSANACGEMGRVVGEVGYRTALIVSAVHKLSGCCVRNPMGYTHGVGGYLAVLRWFRLSSTVGIHRTISRQPDACVSVWALMCFELYSRNSYEFRVKSRITNALMLALSRRSPIIFSFDRRQIPSINPFLPLVMSSQHFQANSHSSLTETTSWRCSCRYDRSCRISWFPEGLQSPAFNIR